jgi:hypothetical protein
VKQSPRAADQTGREIVRLFDRLAPRRHTYVSQIHTYRSSVSGPRARSTAGPA